MISQSYRRTVAFTLIELLVVIGIIGLLAGVIGMALGGGDSGTALRASQSTVFSLVASARGQAILNQGTARLVVYADTTKSPTTNNLRYLQVISTPDATPTAASVWTATGDGVTLGGGVYVVPPTAAGTMNLIQGTTPYASNLRSLLLPGPATFTVSGTDIGKTYYIEFSQLGTPTEVTAGSSVYGTFVLSTASPDPTNPAVPQFNNPLNVRGLLIRKLGSSTLLNSADDF